VQVGVEQLARAVHPLVTEIVAAGAVTAELAQVGERPEQCHLCLDRRVSLGFRGRPQSLVLRQGALSVLVAQVETEQQATQLPQAGGGLDGHGFGAPLRQFQVGGRSGGGGLLDIAQRLQPDQRHPRLDLGSGGHQ